MGHLWYPCTYYVLPRVNKTSYIYIATALFTEILMIVQQHVLKTFCVLAFK